MWLLWTGCWLLGAAFCGHPPLALQVTRHMRLDSDLGVPLIVVVGSVTKCHCYLSQDVIGVHCDKHKAAPLSPQNCLCLSIWYISSVI